MSVEGRQLGDRGVEFQPMPAPPQPEPAPRTLNAKATVSVILTVVGIAMMVAASAGLWGGWAAMFTAGFAVSLMAVLVGWDT